MNTSHSILEVINVGHGDCMILRPQQHCDLYNRTFIIDTGNGSVDFSRYLDDLDDNISLILSHSHQDHIGGLFRLWDKINKINEIILPFYFNEIVLIAKSLKNALGIDAIPHNSWPIQRLNQYETSYNMLHSLIGNTTKQNLIYGYEGYNLCSHFKILNPCTMFSETDPVDCEYRIRRISSLFSEPLSGNLSNWLHAGLIENQECDISILDHTPIPGEEFQYNQYFYKFNNTDNMDNGNLENASRRKAYFVLAFFERNYEQFLSFAHSPTVTKLTSMVNSLELTANNASLVFSFEVLEFNETSRTILFTGDVDASVFERLISNNIDIHANILKVPHHGSKKGLNDYVLRKIKPNTAIISHNNKRFGRAKDPHPNNELIALLQRYNTSIYATNDIIKNGEVIIENSRGKKNTIFELL